MMAALVAGVLAVAGAGRMLVRRAMIVCRMIVIPGASMLCRLGAGVFRLGDAGEAMDRRSHALEGNDHQQHHQ